MSKALKGSIPPVITPFSNNEIDLASYKKLIEFHVEEGSHGILVNGTSAEPSTLTVEEKNQLVDVAIVTVVEVIEVVEGVVEGDAVVEGFAVVVVVTVVVVVV